MKNPYHSGVLILEVGLLPKEVTDIETVSHLIKKYGAVEVRLCPYTGLWLLGAPPERVRGLLR
jgi:hypothetical protein